jgi:hypothetical protein
MSRRFEGAVTWIRDNSTRGHTTEEHAGIAEGAAI